VPRATFRRLRRQAGKGGLAGTTITILRITTTAFSPSMGFGHAGGAPDMCPACLRLPLLSQTMNTFSLSNAHGDSDS